MYQYLIYFLKKVLKHNLPPYIHFITSASRIWEHVNEFPSTGQTLHNISDQGLCILHPSVYCMSYLSNMYKSQTDTKFLSSK